jgi:hypothetical protein
MLTALLILLHGRRPQGRKDRALAREPCRGAHWGGICIYWCIRPPRGPARSFLYMRPCLPTAYMALHRLARCASAASSQLQLLTAHGAAAYVSHLVSPGLTTHMIGICRARLAARGSHDINAYSNTLQNIKYNARAKVFQKAKKISLHLYLAHAPSLAALPTSHITTRVTHTYHITHK